MIVAVTLEVKAAVEMVNEALVWPAATITDAGTVTPLAVLSLESAMARPPAGAALDIVSEPAAEVPPTTVNGEIVSLLMTGPLT